MKRYSLVLLGVVSGAVAGSLITALAISKDIENQQPVKLTVAENREQMMALRNLTEDISQIKQRLDSLGVQKAEQINAGANPILQTHGPASNAQGLNMATSPSPEEEAHFQAFSQRVNQQLASRTLTLPAIMEDPEMRTLPQSLQKKLLLDIARRVNNKELDIKAVLPDEN